MYAGRDTVLYYTCVLHQPKQVHRNAPVKIRLSFDLAQATTT